jgi:hypothetical protein
MQHVTPEVKNSCWLTKGLRISCKWKESLHILSRHSNCSIIKTYYTQYCIILRKVIRKAKQNYYNNLLSVENKSKTIWSIIYNESGKVNNNNNFTPSLFKLDKTNIQTDHAAEAFSQYFLN